MKTVTDAALENANEVKMMSVHDREFLAFTKGAEFAQRWVPVEEELPTKQGHYLVIAPRSYPKNCTVVVAEFYEDNNTFYSESSDEPLEDVTHWRQIEVK